VTKLFDGLEDLGKLARTSAFFAALFLVPATGVSSADVRIRDLHWLSGCWTSNGGESGSGEQWMYPAGGSMLGVNRSVRNGRTTAFEFMRIVETDNEGLMLIASPSGQPAATFMLASISGGEVIFENPDHDFPQRIAYRKLPDSGLLGWIDGEINGSRRRVEFPMTAIDCLAEPQNQ
jgi:hypothetical protein